jgi:hypothetical protein
MSAIKTSSVFVAVILGLFAGSADAQSVIAVKVPFAFTVGHKEFPAGHYQLTVGDSVASVISIRDRDTGMTAFVLSNTAGGFDPAGNQPALLFEKYENEYRLSEIWESTTYGREFPGLSGNKQIAQTGAPAGFVSYIVEAERR